MLSEIPQNIPLKDLPALDLIRSKARIIRHETGVLLKDVIDDTDVAIDDRRVKELASSMLKLGCQLEPSLLAAIEENGTVKYIIINGFHRRKAAEIAGIKDTNATVLYGFSEEEIYDLRVIAGTPKSVGFARSVDWIQKSFDKSVWAKRGLTLLQVLSIAHFSKIKKRTNIKHYGIEQSDIPEITKWVNDKSDKWKKPVTSLIGDFYCLEQSFPEIINQVRINYGGGHAGSGILSLQKFKQMIDIFPKNLELQRLMLRLIRKHNFDSIQVKIVSNRIRELIENHQLEEKMVQLETDPLSLFDANGGKKSTYEDSAESAYRKKWAKLNREKLLKQLFLTDDRRLDILRRLDRLEIKHLSGRLFYEDMNITIIERTIAQFFFEQSLEIEEITVKLKMSKHQVLNCFWNVLYKYRLEIEEIINYRKCHNSTD